MNPEEVALHAGKRVRNTATGTSGWLGSLWNYAGAQYAELRTGDAAIELADPERIVVDDGDD